MAETQYMVLVVDRKTKAVIKRLGPMALKDTGKKVGELKLEPGQTASIVEADDKSLGTVPIDKDFKPSKEDVAAADERRKARKKDKKAS